MPSVGILGGGISGLTAAFQLHKQGIDVTVLEASKRTGGKIRSERTQGYLVEHGPNTIQTATPLMEALIEQLGLADDLIEAAETAKKRYVVRNGTPHPLPTSPTDLLASPLLSTSAKLRLLAEPLVWSRSPDPDESVAAFVRRRLGREALDYGINPFVGGIFAGDPTELSIRHAFETLFELEREHGSLFKGMIQRRRNADDDASSTRRMFSFRDGIQTLPDALTAKLGSRIQRLSSVIRLQPKDDHWIVTTRNLEDASRTDRSFDAVISTLPLHRFARIEVDTVVQLNPLEKVDYPPVSVVALGFKREDVDHPLDGFGVLVPEVETQFRILGCLFSSSLFPDRAPDGHVLLTTYIGGARNPDLGRADLDTLLPLVREDLKQLLGARGEPTFVHQASWPHAIPQYATGYAHVTSTLDTLENRHPRLALAGNYRRGISVGDAMASGDEAAQRILAALNLT